MFVDCEIINKLEWKIVKSININDMCNYDRLKCKNKFHLQQRTHGNYVYILVRSYFSFYVHVRFIARNILGTSQMTLTKRLIIILTKLNQHL